MDRKGGFSGRTEVLAEDILSGDFSPSLCLYLYFTGSSLRRSWTLVDLHTGAPADNNDGGGTSHSGTANSSNDFHNGHTAMLQ